AGGAAEFLFSMLMAPSVALAVAMCCIGLVMGKRIRWDAQQRSRDFLSLREAARSLWPQTLYGAALLGGLGWYAPWALAFGSLIVAPLCLVVLMASASTAPRLGEQSRQLGLFDIPEDRAGLCHPVLETVAPQAA
ncbi:MAG TPA: hypothetical protein VKA18_08635, partial [Alphaproteobacteria bacterium]|nr:hypothetical protein [Alphaproteobacteria bacterium]